MNKLPSTSQNGEALPEAYKVPFRRAKAYSFQKDWNRAVRFYKMSANYNPSDWQIYFHLGNAILELEQQSFQNHHTLVPLENNFQEELALEDTISKLQSWDEAITAYKRALELNPDSRVIHEKLSYLLQYRANATRFVALNFYYQQIQLNPNKAENYHKAIEIEPYDLNLYLGLGNALAKKEYWEQAIAIYQIALQIDPNHRLVRAQLNAVLAQLSAKTASVPYNLT